MSEALDGTTSESSGYRIGCNCSECAPETARPAEAAKQKVVDDALRVRDAAVGEWLRLNHPWKYGAIDIGLAARKESHENAG